ncbi:MAG: hypothetical protein CM15mP83_4870 [Flavobacteriaceae bacterium]|nr:MAG: hypothetical protein CM15mP83_4870 [Flavobacteriaceae bacterium]
MIGNKILIMPFNLDVPHISSYALTLEPKTALERFVDKGVVSLWTNSLSGAVQLFG